MCQCGNESIQFVCMDCRAVVCSSCRGAEHEYHGTERFDVVSEELRGKLSTVSTEPRKLDDLMEKQTVVRDMTKELLCLKKKAIDEMERHLAELH